MPGSMSALRSGQLRAVRADLGWYCLTWGDWGRTDIKWVSKDGVWSVETISLIGTPNPTRPGDATGDGAWFCVRLNGKLFGHVRTPAEVDAIVPLANLRQVDGLMCAPLPRGRGLAVAFRPHLSPARLGGCGKPMTPLTTSVQAILARPRSGHP